MKPLLKNCPFCNRETVYEQESDHHGEFFQLGCPDRECPAYWTYYTEPIENKDKSIAAWNQRAGEQA